MVKHLLKMYQNYFVGTKIKTWSWNKGTRGKGSARGREKETGRNRSAAGWNGPARRGQERATRRKRQTASWKAPARGAYAASRDWEKNARGKGLAKCQEKETRRTESKMARGPQALDGSRPISILALTQAATRGKGSARCQEKETRGRALARCQEKETRRRGLTGNPLGGWGKAATSRTAV